MKLIGIAGKAGSGKDTVADYLWESHEFTKIAFADPLRRATEVIFGLDAHYLTDRLLKEQEVPYWGSAPRRILQDIGHGLKALFGDDLWLKRWNLSYQMLEQSDHVVVPDVRFDLEADAIRHLGGAIIHLERPGAGLTGEAGQHPSEAGVTRKPGDFFLVNDSTIADLHLNIEGVLYQMDRRRD